MYFDVFQAVVCIVKMQKESAFSQNLIDETIRCFQEEDGVLLSEQEAIDALENMAELFLAYVRPKATPARPRAAGLPDLLTASLNEKEQ